MPLAALALCACQGNDPGASGGAAARSQELGDIGYLSLCCGLRETVVGGITSAENLIFSSDGRLFVSGDDGVFELVRGATGRVQSRRLTPDASCHFSGLAENAGVLYAGCYDFTDSYVYAASLSATPSFRAIHTLQGVVLANGLAADAAGNLYVATTLQGTILRLQFASGDPFTVARVETWEPDTGGIAPNGLKYYDSALYLTDALGTISHIRILPDGRAGAVRTLVQRLTVFDDLYVDQNGIVVADYLAGALQSFSVRGTPIGQSGGLTAFDSPSAVVPANGRLGFGDKDLLVTEKGSDRVAVFHLAF